jgi:hypothetical protein
MYDLKKIDEWMDCSTLRCGGLDFCSQGPFATSGASRPDQASFVSALNSNQCEAEYNHQNKQPQLSGEDGPAQNQ